MKIRLISVCLFLINSCLYGFYAPSIPFGFRRISHGKYFPIFSVKKVNSFADYGAFPAWLIESCAKHGFVSPTEVQALALPVFSTLF
jgi:hypothetical protein